MSLYAIGDLHLSFGTDKPMDVFGGNWAGYTEKLGNAFGMLKEDDVCVLCGDLSWAMALPGSLADFKYIDNLPGRKIILKGNHDYWWTTVSKMSAFFKENGLGSISILHNNCYFYDGTAICGTRGWLHDDTLGAGKNEKIAAREVLRLRASLQAAADADPQDGILCFFHFPPRFGNMVCHEMISVMNEYNVKRCYYGHIHGHGHKLAVRGSIDGIEYDIISSDYLDFKPLKIL